MITNNTVATTEPTLQQSLPKKDILGPTSRTNTKTKVPKRPSQNAMLE
jgi:hypothetical protein